MKKLLIIVLIILSTNTYASNYAQERECLAKAIYWEARGEHLVGKLAVSSLIMYRVKSEDFPNTICLVVKQFNKRLKKPEFSSHIIKNTKPRELSAWQESLQLSDNILSGRYKFQFEFTARFFHSVHVNPNWNNKKLVAVIGNNKFYY